MVKTANRVKGAKIWERHDQMEPAFMNTLRAE